MNPTIGSRRVILALLLLGLAKPAACAEGTAPPPIDPRRLTPTVKLLKKCLPSVVAIQTFRKHKTPGVFTISVGSGTVIHPAGFILTNDHVVRGAVRGTAGFSDGRSYDFRIIARFPHEDLALVKINAKQPLPAMTLGRSDDLLLGEPVIVIGNPAGLAHTASTGIISGLNRATATEDAFLPWMIQTSAASSGGNSGGPLLNALGEQIGVITSKKIGAENANFAIAIDRVREMFPKMIAAEERYGISIGLKLDVLAREARITAVASNSPAAKAGLKAGDVIRRIDQWPLRSAMDYQMALIDRKPDETLKFDVRRGDKSLSAEVKLAGVKLPEPVAAEGMAPGLNFATYKGQWSQLPDFDKLKPVKTGRTDRVTLKVQEGDRENFGVTFTGLLKIPADGLYSFYTTSDDGSRMTIAGRTIVDNDGLHANRQAAGLMRLPAGLHPITVSFFEAGGDEALQVFVDDGKSGKREIPADWFFVREASDTKK
jgi:S1-C subfamily serine protease